MHDQLLQYDVSNTGAKDGVYDAVPMIIGCNLALYNHIRADSSTAELAALEHSDDDRSTSSWNSVDHKILERIDWRKRV